MNDPVTPKPAPRLLAMMPAGRRHDHDQVSIYNNDPRAYAKSYFNLGDMMVYDSMLKMLSFSDFDVLKILNPTQADIERYNARFDYIVLRGSNFVHEGMGWHKAPEVLEKVKLPIIALGVGAQAETRRKIKLPASSVKVWKIIAERSRFIGVRGVYTAEVLNDHGITNVEVVGCPSIFRQRKRDLKLKIKPKRDIKRVAFSLRRETHPLYTPDINRFIDWQRSFLLRLAQAYDVTITLHGEPEEKAFVVNDEGLISESTLKLRASGWFTPTTEERLKQLYQNNLFINESASAYDEAIRRHDLAIGYRVHGILPALAQGVPAVQILYDSRSAELAETFHIPVLPDSSLITRSMNDIYDPSWFEAFHKHFPQRYDAMRAFLDANGVAHRLGEPETTLVQPAA